VLSVAVTADGRTAVSGSQDKSVRVWDLASGEERSTLTGHTGPVWSVAVTADGRTAVSGSEDRSVRVWDLASGLERSTLTGHTGPVWSVAITEDGTAAVSGGGDASIRVWDPATGMLIARWYGDHPIVGSSAIPGHPLKVGIGQRLGDPYLLEIRGLGTAAPAASDARYDESALTPNPAQQEFRCPGCKAQILPDPDVMITACPRCFNFLPVELCRALGKAADMPQPKPLQPVRLRGGRTGG